MLTVHQGCGLTNAMTGIAEAAKSRTPLLVLAADTGAAAVRSNFRIDQDALVTRRGRRRRAGALARVGGRATSSARTGRPSSSGARSCSTCPWTCRPPPAPDGPLPAVPAPGAGPAGRRGRRRAGRADRRPRSARCSSPAGARGAAGRELRALGTACGALLATSAVANGLFAGDPWALGISGGFASPLAAELIRDADLIVGWGCALNMWTTRHGTLIGSGARVVQVDLDADAIGAHRPVDLGRSRRRRRHGDRRRWPLVAPRTGYRTDAVRAAIAQRVRWRDVPYDDLTATGGIDPRTLSIGLDDVLPRERTVAVDSGNFMGYPSAYLAVPDEAGFCFTQAFQSIGLGLATAIGAALARPGPAARRRARRRRRADGGRRAGDRGTAGAADGRRGLQRRGYGAEVHHFA